MSKIITISIPNDGQYELVAPFIFDSGRLSFTNYALSGKDISSILGFKVDKAAGTVEIPAGIIFTLKVNRTRHNNKIELHAYKKYNKGVEPFYLYGSASLFSGIQLEPQ